MRVSLTPFIGSPQKHCVLLESSYLQLESKKMKRVLVLIAVMAFMSSLSFAQLKYGVKVGGNISKVRITEGGMKYSFDSKVGLLAGGFARYALSDLVAIQPELLFIQYGHHVNRDIEGEPVNETLYLNYLALPVMVKYYLGDFNLQAGPQLGFLINAKTTSNGESEDTIDDWRSMDLILNLGLGYELEMGLGFDVRYGFSLSNIAENLGDDTAKNNGFQISASYAF